MITWCAAPTMWPVCPDCGSELEWDPGMLPTYSEDQFLPTMYCPNCGIDYPDVPKPKETK